MHNPRELSRLVRHNLRTVQSFASNVEAGAAEAEVEADRALLEMAAQLRVLDDALELSRDLRESAYPPLGVVVQGDGRRLNLHFRDMTNKVMHASKFEWSVGENSIVTCIGNGHDRWQSAEISLTALADLCERVLP